MKVWKKNTTLKFSFSNPSESMFCKELLLFISITNSYLMSNKHFISEILHVTMFVSSSRENEQILVKYGTVLAILIILL